MGETRAEIRLPTQELRDDLPFYTKVLGMRLDMIYPADNPEVAVLSGHGLRVRIEKGAPEPAGTLRILTEDPAQFANGARVLTAPNGTRIEIDDLNPPLVLPSTEHAFVVRRLADQAPWVIGRAGMEYRDLIPTRLGGAMIASHIRVPDGPVPDMVHFHKVGFQLIFCVAGWVDVLYEDQGGILRIEAGDCFIQPPGIRHKVLHSEGVQVVEIGVPADHITEIDHEMTFRRRICALSVNGRDSVLCIPWRATAFLRRIDSLDLRRVTRRLQPIRKVWRGWLWRDPKAGQALGRAMGGIFYFPLCCRAR